MVPYTSLIGRKIVLLSTKVLVSVILWSAFAVYSKLTNLGIVLSRIILSAIDTLLLLAIYLP
jgi:hypothetical protein